MEYDAANRLIRYNGEEVRYDACGNMTYGPVDGRMQELTYDCRNRLVSAGGITYTYDAANHRTGMGTASCREEYLVDPVSSDLDRILVSWRYDKSGEEESTGSDGEADVSESETASVTSYIYGQGLISHTGESGTVYYHYNHLGSTTRLTDESGNTLARYTYGAYGELMTGDTSLTRFLYNGRCGVSTDENGLYYMRQRYYDPQIRRFINQDILTGNIGESQSLNRYCYVQGNPVSYTDPFGLYPFLGSIDGWTLAHGVLDLLGCIPGPLGMIANGINAAIYAVVDLDQDS